MPANDKMVYTMKTARLMKIYCSSCGMPSRVREGGREEGRKGGREGGREGGRKGGREGRRKGGSERGRGV